jgi:hypothetical protein
MRKACWTHCEGRPSFSHDETLGSLQNDGELFVFWLCCLQDRHDLLHGGYEVARGSVAG